MVWYVDFALGLLGRLNPKTGEVKAWPSPSGPRSAPYAIAVVDDIIWYNESNQRPDALVRFDPKTEKFQSWAIPSGVGIIRHMTVSPDGNLVIHQSSINRINITLSQRQDAHRGHRPFHAAALHPAQRSRLARSAIWLRTGPVRGVHSHHQRRGDSVVHHAVFGRERARSRPSKGLAKTDAPPLAAGLDRRAGAAVRFLPERADHDGQGAARRNPNPTDAQIREGMAGALCRCMTYYRIQAAIKRAACCFRE